MKERDALKSDGFSLVELSIVLVILGLLVGGVLAGQSLIRAAELRAVSTEYARYTTAVQTFRDKYFTIPGNMSNATQFWGRMNGNADCVTNSAAAVSGNGACDGNGDAILGHSPAASQAGETPQFWRQLALAGLIEGTYSGVAGTGGSQHCVVGSDCPKGKLPNAGWGASSMWINFPGDIVTYKMDYGNAFRMGSQSTGTQPGGAVLTPEEAWNIDTKLDDGKPATGTIIGTRWNNGCAAADDGVSANDDLVASYRLTVTSLECGLYFRNAF